MMVELGTNAGRKMTALISNMEEPLGYNVGNSLEVIEAIKVLNGEGPDDLFELSTALAGLMYASCFGVPFEESRSLAEEAIRNGKAKEKLRELVKAQRGDARLIDRPECFETSRYTQTIRASQSGYLYKMDTEAIGLTSSMLGAGRETKEDSVEYTAGIQILKKTGDWVNVGDTLAVLRTRRERSLHDAEEKYLSGLTFSDKKPEKEPLIYKIIQ